jgi:hypothetical protein
VVSLNVTDTPAGRVVDVIFEMFCNTDVPGKKLSALNTYVEGMETPEYNPVIVVPSVIDPTNKTVSV